MCARVRHRWRVARGVWRRYACSILYKLKLPLVLALNKTDVTPCDYALRWMSDLDSFSEALQAERSYMGSLAQSMALMLEEFYASLRAVGVSALSGDGIDDFFAAIDAAALEYDETCACPTPSPHGHTNPQNLPT